MWRILPPVAATIVLLVLALREGGRGGRGEREDAPPVQEPPAAAAPAPPPEIDFDSVPDRDVPATIRGTVFDPYGRPVPGADLMVVKPRVLEAARADAEGRYELTVWQPGPHLVEASFTIHLAARRLEVVVPDEGDPAPLDFHLGTLGFVFGELVASGHPVREGTVDILQGDEWILDTTCENGIFCFTDEPPKDVPPEPALPPAASASFPPSPPPPPASMPSEERAWPPSAVGVRVKVPSFATDAFSSLSLSWMLAT